MLKKLLGFAVLGFAALLLIAWPGPAQTVHSITLTWGASTTTGAHYNVYRGTATGGPYTKLTTASLGGLTYADTTGTAGTKYFYVVTAVCDTTATCPSGVNGESGFSTEVNGTFFGNPAAVTGLQAVSN